MSKTETKWPQEFTSGIIEIVHKDGKKYYKTGHYKLAYYTFEEVKHEQIELPDKLRDIRSHS